MKMKFKKQNIEVDFHENAIEFLFEVNLFINVNGTKEFTPDLNFVKKYNILDIKKSVFPVGDFNKYISDFLIECKVDHIKYDGGIKVDLDKCPYAADLIWLLYYINQEMVFEKTDGK